MINVTIRIRLRIRFSHADAIGRSSYELIHLVTRGLAGVLKNLFGLDKVGVGVTASIWILNPLLSLELV